MPAKSLCESRDLLNIKLTIDENKVREQYEKTAFSWDHGTWLW